MRRCLPVLLFCFAAAGLAFSQQAQMEANVVRAEAGPAAPAAKVDAAELKRNQQRARELLNVSEAEARGLEAPGRAQGLMQIAEAFTPLDRGKAAGLLKDAFTATTEMDPAKAEDKRFLQDRIFIQLINLDPESVPELLAQAEPDSRSQAYGRLISRAAQSKNFSRAVDLVNQVAGEQIRFPYGAVATLMMALPPEQVSERQNAFMQAFSAYQRESGGRFGTDGFDRLIVRFGGALPKQMILNAVDEVLKRAKASDQEARFTLSSASGSAAFNSSYDYYLFELLPVIRRYDPARADDLLKENTQIAGVLQQFPNGIQSLDPTIRDTPAKPGENSGLGMMINSGNRRQGGGSGGSAPGMQADQVRAQYESEVAKIRAEARKNPRQAIARSMALPESIGRSHPRAEALEGVARESWKEEPAAAKSALDELVKMTASLKPEERRPYQVNAADLYIRLGDKDAAKKVIESGIKAAEALYDEDKNPDDPNTALKGYWPSTQAWAQCVMLAQRVSPELPEQVIAGIKDDEVRTSVRVAYAMALAGGGAPRSSIVMISRGHQRMMSVSENPQ